MTRRPRNWYNFHLEILHLFYAEKNNVYFSGESFGRFTSLDAAGPLFDKCSAGCRVDETDADYVDFIHTGKFNNFFVEKVHLKKRHF